MKDLKSDNFLIGFEDGSVLEDYIQRQQNHTADCILSNDHPIYRSEPDFGHLRKGVSLIKISNFNTAVFGNVPTTHNYNIQPMPFCAPEVLLEAPWTYSVDIWNLDTIIRNLQAYAIYKP